MSYITRNFFLWDKKDVNLLQPMSNYKRIVFLVLFVTLMFPLQMCSCNKPNSDFHNCSVMTQYAQIIESHHIKIDILSVDEIYITESFYVKQEHDFSLSSLDFWLNHSLQELRIYDGKGTLNFTNNEVTNSSNLISVDFRNQLEQNQTTYFYLLYKLDKLPISENSGSFYVFEFESSITYFTEFHEIAIKIPPKSSIHEEGELRSFSLSLFFY